MNIKIFATGIIADQPTSNGSIYDKSALEQAVRAFNIKAKNRAVPGSLIDRENIEKYEPVTHQTELLFINESGMLCAQIKLLDPKLIADLENGTKVIGRPIISVPSFELDRSPLRVTNINEIIRVQLECNDEPERSQEPNQEGGDSQCKSCPDAEPAI